MLLSLAEGCAPGGESLPNEDAVDGHEALKPKVVAVGERTIRDVVVAGDKVYWSAFENSWPNKADDPRHVRMADEFGVKTAAEPSLNERSLQPLYWNGDTLYGLITKKDAKSIFGLSDSVHWEQTFTDLPGSAQFGVAEGEDLYCAVADGKANEGPLVDIVRANVFGGADHWVYQGDNEWPASTAMAADDTWLYFVIDHHSDPAQPGWSLFRKKREGNSNAIRVSESLGEYFNSKLVRLGDEFFRGSCSANACRIERLANKFIGLALESRDLPSTQTLLDWEVDETHFYWVAEGTGLWRMRRDGSEVTQLDPLGEDVTLGDEVIYWVKDRATTLARVPKSLDPDPEFVPCEAPVDTLEICNGVDDNCDGGIDEGNPEGGAACDTGKLGQCALGIVTCVFGKLECVPQHEPVWDVCNNDLDEDCNGTTPRRYFTEDFSDNAAGWTLGNGWEIGPAVVSSCANTAAGNDPASDLTPSDDNGVAGTLIGGCYPADTSGKFCLTSPEFDLSEVPEKLSVQYSVRGDAQAELLEEVFNGVTWELVYAPPPDAFTDWYYPIVDFTDYKGPNSRFRICFKQGTSANAASSGLTVDDVVLASSDCYDP